jgi:hypothetical protein
VISQNGQEGGQAGRQRGTQNRQAKRHAKQTGKQRLFRLREGRMGRQAGGGREADRERRRDSGVENEEQRKGKERKGKEREVTDKRWEERQEGGTADRLPNRQAGGRTRR